MVSTSTPRDVTPARLLAALVPAMMLVPVSADMMSLLLPRIGERFDASTAQTSWVVSGFVLACAVGIPCYGRIVDRVGLRRLFRGALVTFAVGAVISAVAPALPLLVGGRIVTGVGGAAVPVLAIVAVTRALPADRAAVGVGFLAAAGGAGAAAGPVVGGLLGQSLGWQSPFWLTAALAALLVPAVARVLPVDAATDSRAFDLSGGVLLGLGTGALLFGITRVESAGVTSPSSWSALLTGAAALALFGMRMRTAEQPFVPPSLFRHRGYGAAVLVIFSAMAANLAMLVLVPVLVVDVHGLIPAHGSLVMIPGGVALAVMSPVVGRLGARGLNEGTGALIGLAVMGGAAASLYALADAAPVVIVAPVVALGAGFAVVVTLATSVVSRVLPPEHVGTGVGIFQGAQFLGAATGPAVYGAVLAFCAAAVDGAAAYRPVFLLLLVPIVLGGIAALRLRAALRNA
ncbi:MFS transporter [Prauserella alba]|uniref:MFS transporter n=1 Tax=Prauserella alba TaxID=176898 RepID=A0ABN1VDW3_9PSEU|nr:MFS transporter [Prauserella alba]MCP2179120.1 MFS transporter, DHA2 family, metal-tetracycline-proton antiporter [Prauserella alba]